MNLSVRTLATDARVEAVRVESDKYDLVVMGATRTKAIRKFFFGSLAETVVTKIHKSMLIVYMPADEV